VTPAADELAEQLVLFVVDLLFEPGRLRFERGDVE
jgi:hypothetical protein